MAIFVVYIVILLIMGVLIVILIVAIIVGIRLLITISNQKDRQRQLDSALESTKNFSTSFTVKNCDSRYMFCVDDNKRKILCIIANDDTNHLFDFENVISVEIIEDCNTTYSKSSARTIGGGVIGGIIGGGAGAIIGGLSGNNKGKKKVKEITVKILLRNYPSSTIYLECLRNQQTEWDTDDFVYKIAKEEATKILDKLSVIIDLIDREEKSKQNTLAEIPSSSTNSIADELEKIYSLKEKGIISVEEYDKLKTKLLQ